MANEAIALYDDANYLPCKASAAVTGKTFVALSDDQTADGNFQVAVAGDGAEVLGIVQQDADPADPATDGHVTVAAGPGLIMPVTAGAAVARNAPVQSNAAGRAITLAAGARAGKALTSAAADGDEIFVQLHV